MITVKIIEENEGASKLNNITVDYLLELLLSHKHNYLEIVDLQIDDYKVTDINKLASVLL